MLGFGTVRTLALAAGIIGRFPAGTGPAFDRAAFWQHSIGTGVCASVLAAATGHNGEQAFTAGLLHVVGRLMLDVHFPQEFAQVVAYHDEQECTFLEAERAVLGLDDAGIGGEMARQWKLPVPIQEAIRDYPHPREGGSAMADLVHVADVVCHALEIGNAGDKWVPNLDEGAWARLGLDWQAVPRCFGNIEHQNAGLTLLID
jgi:HD-like signal output (HDOD) protein